jgi:D-tagatose-bisphosphate aldolase class II non-catalytic subunit
MAMADILRDIIRRNRAGERIAIPSVCSAHPEVLRASLMLARALNQPVVIEATSNQVNQDGGYTGQRPADFVALVRRLADQVGLAADRLILGGDHLGPQAWRAGAAAAAMAKARVMVAAYAEAGFTKIHLDCSEGCAGEPAQLGDAVTAARAADLAAVALRAAPDPAALIFVIGTEVPPPGGARMDEAGEIAPTTPASARATLAAHAAAFQGAGIGAALAQIGGLVVQPGVEFSPMAVHPLPMERDPGLVGVLADWPGLCLEAHSTDYQPDAVFPRLAELGFAFLKVGPALTFALRRAVYALDALAGQMGWREGASLPEVMERLMQADPSHWQQHYHRGSGDLRLARHFGLADRIRYYWPQPEAEAAMAALMRNMGRYDLPDPLLQQGFSGPVIQSARQIGGPMPQALVLAEIQAALSPYFWFASGGVPRQGAPS